jgi:hypothetical protein
MGSLPKSNIRTGEDVVERGQKMYRQALSSILEPLHDGEYVAVEPVSGKYFLGRTASEALVSAHAALPDEIFYLTRVGRETAHTVGGYARGIR